MSDLLNSLTGHLMLSPASIVEPTIELVDDIYDRAYDISDENSPWLKLLECSATHAAAAQIQANVLTRRQYPKLAESFEDLYLHMSDADYLGRFSTPNSGLKVWWAAPTADIIEQAVQDPSIDMKKLTIPADTLFTVGGYDLYLHWPVDIVVSADNRLSARYNLSFSTPTKERVSNTANFETMIINNEEYFMVELDTDQLTPIESTTPISAATGSSLSLNFSDMFYHARVFHSTDDVTWTEVPTTHNDLTFDPNIPTALLKVRQGAIDVRIPDIYLSNGKVKGKLKAIVYTTKGYTEIPLSVYTNPEWSARFNDFNNLTQTWSENLSKINRYIIFGRDTFKGGRGEKTFEEMKNQVVYSYGEKAAPYTEEELRAELDKSGFRVSKQRDTVMGRTFVASSPLPVPNDKINLTSPAGMINADVRIDDSRLDISRAMVKNDLFTIIRPGSLFKGEFGTYSLVTDGDRNTIESLDVRDLAEYLNENDLYYNPFHYVLDSSDPIFAARAYWLKEPKEYARSYIENNSSLGFLVSTTDVSVELDNENDVFTVVVKTAAPGNGEDVLAVLNYSDPVTGKKWDIVSTSTKIDSNNYEYRFNFGSLLDIDINNFFTLTGMTGEDLIDPRVRLDSTIFDMVYVLEGAGTSSFDGVLARNALSQPVTAISHEQITIQWGQHLDKLYVRSKAISQPPVFKYYEEDRLAYYEKDEYLTGIEGYVLEENSDGDLEPVLLHSAGDIMYEEDGETPIYIWRKGELARDPSTKNPIELEPATIVREVRIAMFDASLGFSTTQTSVTYRDTLPSFILSKIKRDMADWEPKLLEETELFYEPIATQTSARAEVENGKERILSSALKWKVKIQLYEASYENDGIRANIRKGIRNVLSRISEDREISLSKVYGELKDLSPQDIRSISVESPFGENTVARLLDDNAKWSIASVAIPLSNGSLEVQDDITFDWVL